MHFRMNIFVALVALSFMAVAVRPARSEEPKKPAPEAAPTPQQVRSAAERGLVFLEKDAVAWREKKTCSTCHHGTMTVWALSEAKSQGYAVAPETLADMVKWTKDRVLDGVEKPRDTRIGWNMVNTPAVFLAVMAQVVPKQDAVSADDLKRIASQLVRHQEADGSWAWSIAPLAALCTSTGGTVGSSLCCGSASDFPDRCATGACGCAPGSSHTVQVCNCVAGRCFTPTAGCHAM